MKKTLKKSLTILLSLMMIISVFSVGAAVSSDTVYTMIAIVAMKPQEGDALLATRHIFNITGVDLTALNGGTPVDLGSFGFEADWGIAASSDAYGDYHAGNWDQSSWGYDANGHLYFETRFPLTGGSTPAEEYAAAGRGEVKGFIRDVDSEPKDGIVHDSLNRAYVPDLKANETFAGNDTVRLVLTTEEVYYAPDVTTKTVMLNNCDSADRWACFPGDGLELTTTKKTQGTGSIHTIQSGGFVQGGPIANLDLTGIRSISFDFAANTAEALSGPKDVAFYLFSGTDFTGYQALSDVDTSKVMAFDVNAIRAGYGKNVQSFATITTTPVSIGANFDITNVTGFMFWGCTDYGGDHEQWIDKIVAKVINDKPVDAEVGAVIEAINALPEARAVVASDRYAIFAAKSAYDALSDTQKAYVSNIDKLTAAIDAVNAFKIVDYIVLDECTSVENWSSADCKDIQLGAVNIWWPLRATVKFTETKNLTGYNKIFVDWTNSSMESELGGTHDFEDVFSRELAPGLNADDYGIVLTSYDGVLSPVDKLSNNEAYTTYAAKVVVVGDVVAGENTFVIDYENAGPNFDVTHVTGMAFIGRPGAQSTYFHALKAVKETWPISSAAQAVIDAIDALPEANNVTLGHADAIESALSKYNALSEGDKRDVTNIDKLNQVKAAIDAIIAEESKLFITLTGSEVYPGASVSIPLTVSGGEIAKNIASFHVVVNYDPAILTPCADDAFFTASDILSGSAIDVNTNSAQTGAGKAEIAVLKPNAIGIGQWGTLNFTVDDDAAVGTVTEVSMTDCEDIATPDFTLITDITVNAASITVLESPHYTLVVSKIDGDKSTPENKVPLAGAEFTLYKKDNGGDKTIIYKDQSIKCSVVGSAVTALNSGGTKAVAVFQDNLDPKKEYYLAETRAPSGYRLLDTTLKITIDDSGGNALIDDEIPKEIIKKEVNIELANFLTLHMPTSGTELTGGWFAVVGLALLAAATIGLFGFKISRPKIKR